MRRCESVRRSACLVLAALGHLQAQAQGSAFGGLVGALIVRFIGIGLPVEQEIFALLADIVPVRRHDRLNGGVVIGSALIEPVKLRNF